MRDQRPVKIGPTISNMRKTCPIRRPVYDRCEEVKQPLTKLQGHDSISDLHESVDLVQIRHYIVVIFLHPFNRSKCGRTGIHNTET